MNRTRTEIVRGVAVITALFCISGVARSLAATPADIEVDIEMEFGAGSVTHNRKITGLGSSPLINTHTGLNKRSSVVVISYVGYADFRVPKEAKATHLRPGYVFAVQVLKGEKGVTIETAKKTVSKLVIFNSSPQTLYEDEEIKITIRTEHKSSNKQDAGGGN